jgi:glucans biosynthesis protein
MNRRQFLQTGTLAALAAGLGIPDLANAAPELADPRLFSIDWLRLRAKQLAGHPFRAPADSLPPPLDALDYDQYRDIRFRPDEALWGNAPPFSTQLFHRGFYYRTPVRIFEVIADKSREVKYRPALFTFGANAFDSSTPGADTGFAGLRVHTDLNTPGVMDELLVFLGASYFRALARHTNYGLSARGLAIGTAAEEGEEFPYFSEFYLERPQDANSLVIHALLDSQSVTGVYTFTIRPGADTVIDVVMSLYARTEITKIGIAPLTSMFFFAANDRVGVDDFRPAVHDSDGLMIWNGSGEWIWRPLVNPRQLRVSTFVDRNPKGFGLLQRNRAFADYQDLESRYETRPSAWVEPVGDWGAGGVMLFEIPTTEETNDNIVAFWRPETPLAAGAEWQGSYRLHWCLDPDISAERPAATVATRIGQGGEPGTRRFVLEFAGASLPRDAGASVAAHVTSAGAPPRHVVCHLDEITGSWRVSFDLTPDGAAPVELRCVLTLEDTAVTETWSYQWTE